MSYISRELYLRNVTLSTISGSREIDNMVNRLTSCVLEAKKMAVPNMAHP
jgi:hypothetical protein